MRRRKDYSAPSELFDIYCFSSPAVDDEYVYYQGEFHKDQLYRKKKDGSDRFPQLVASACSGTPILDGDYVYFQSCLYGSYQLLRRLKDGTGPVQLIDDHCIFPPVIRGDFAYIVGGHTEHMLYRKHKDGHGEPQLISISCHSRPALDDEYIYFTHGTNGQLMRRMLQDIFSHSHQASMMLVDSHAASGDIAPVLWRDYVLFRGSSTYQQLCVKRKDGTGQCICLADCCGSTPVIDEEEKMIYILSSSTFHVLRRLPIPNYL
jgi:hypothetical protein